MNGFNLVHVPIRLKDLARWANGRGWAQQGNADLRLDRGRALHHLVVEVFGPQVLSPFRLLQPLNNPTGNLYAYSEMDTGQLRAAAANHGSPDQLCVLNTDRITAKPMPTRWEEGRGSV